jgi:hypothetical protein
MSNEEKEENKESNLDDVIAKAIESIKEQCKPGEIQGFHYLLILKNGDTDGNTVGKPGTEAQMIGIQFTALLNLAMRQVARSQMTEMLSGIKKILDESFEKESTVQ